MRKTGPSWAQRVAPRLGKRPARARVGPPDKGFSMTEPQERRTMPPEAVELYSQFIHGEISRRAFTEKVKRYAVGGLTAAAVIEALMPNYALGQQVAKNDERIKASYVTVPSP